MDAPSAWGRSYTTRPEAGRGSMRQRTTYALRHIPGATSSRVRKIGDRAAVRLDQAAADGSSVDDSEGDWRGGGDGGAERDRTAGLVIANDALSQLSYSPVPPAAALGAAGS